jgi:hypothetical protein
MEKFYITPDVLSVVNYETGFSIPELSKTGQINRTYGFRRWFCIFLFISTEFLKKKS